MNTYFKAQVTLSSERMLKDGSCDPQSYQDHGVVQTFCADTLELLKTKLNQSLDMSGFEVDEEMGLIGQGVAEDEDGKIAETYRIYVTEVREEDASLSHNLRKLLGGV